jgi:hypothetical protein
MMAEVENLVLDHLGHLRGQLDRVESDIGEIKSRLGRLEAVSRKSMSRLRSNRSASIASTRASSASKSGLISRGLEIKRHELKGKRNAIENSSVARRRQEAAVLSGRGR